MTETTYAILTDITPNHADVSMLCADVDELRAALEELGDDCEVYETMQTSVRVGDRVRLAAFGERVSLASL
jgi:hypothetical protein